ncbi:hypothetical protein PRIPAC_87548 [Pristionchus pacificus]|uniref:Uncharacterized protein n=1 Tax=Pristionchus pacificus TaxID=54126 RepID=A0A2A6B8C9_PRIPA|nr:hypothetical protein PRIPAC_87548 [Pristionchus pacificus]|eukprot:PDM62128.1 hypothetical protein PRIPAC_51570 [Pristionchus pacificus]
MEKLREIVRANPSFAANFYHMFTGAFEQEYISKNMKTSAPK